jgi:hypothetical protein
MTKPKQKRSVRPEKKHKQESYSHQQRRDLDYELRRAVRFNDTSQLEENVFHLLVPERET